MVRKFMVESNFGTKHYVNEEAEIENTQDLAVLQQADMLLRNLNNILNEDDKMTCRKFAPKVWRELKLNKYGIFCGHADEVATMLNNCKEKASFPDHFAFVTFDNDFIAWYFNKYLNGNVWEGYEDEEKGGE